MMLLLPDTIKHVEIVKYRLLSDLEKRYGYTRLNSLVVLKDILAHTWNKK